MVAFHIGEDAEKLTRAQTKVFRSRWAMAVQRCTVSAVDTCSGRLPDGTQCEDAVQGENSGVCEAHKNQTMLAELEAEQGPAHEAPCQMCLKGFDGDGGVACVVCFQGIHAEGCWEEVYKSAGLKTPKQEHVEAVLCGLCACLHSSDFQVLWEGGGNPGKVTLIPPTEKQIVLAAELAGTCWLEECFRSLNTNPDAPDYVVQVGQRPVARSKARKAPGGFKPLTTPPVKGRRKELFEDYSSGGAHSDDDSSEDERTERSAAPSARGHRGGHGVEGGLETQLRALAREVAELKNSRLQSGMPDSDEYEASKVLGNISGSATGVKRGEAGSMANLNFAADEPYTGVPDPGHAWHKRAVHSVLGQDDVQGNKMSLGATPEASQNEQILTLVDGNVTVKRSKHSIPSRSTVVSWLDGRADQIQAVLDSDEEGFRSGDKGAVVLVFSLQLASSRYMYLSETMKLLVDEEGLPWQAGWRYMDRFFRVYFLGAMNTSSHMSLQLVEAYRLPKRGMRNAAIRRLVRSFRDVHMLARAEEDHFAAVRQALPAAKGEASRVDKSPRAEKPPKVKGSGGRCPLCLSKDHKYMSGDYGHPAGSVITQACTRMQPDGERCGLIHAFICRAVGLRLQGAP